jgi:prepilin-type N-terminal cleavage/methylation domain-containing protein
MSREYGTKVTTLQKFKTMQKQSVKVAGFTLVEIMVVVAIIALLAAIAVPGFLRARKRSQASKILNDLRMIDAAIDQYAIENNKQTGDPVAVVDWTNYVKKRQHSFRDRAGLIWG